MCNSRQTCRSRKYKYQCKYVQIKLERKSHLCGDKGHLARECPYTGNAVVSPPQATQSPTASLTNPTRITLVLATNHTLSQTITVITPISAEFWQILMDELNKTNQDNKLLKKVVKKKIQQNQTSTAKAKIIPKDTGAKPQIQDKQM